MAQTTMSSRQFNQDLAGAKRAARHGPVVVTDRGQPAFVLMTHAAYRRLAGAGPSLADLLHQEEGADIAFEPARIGDGMVRPAILD
jgi:prevent-host-death family protein